MLTAACNDSGCCASALAASGAAGGCSTREKLWQPHRQPHRQPLASTLGRGALHTLRPTTPRPSVTQGAFGGSFWGAARLLLGWTRRAWPLARPGLPQPCPCPLPAARGCKVAPGPARWRTPAAHRVSASQVPQLLTPLSAGTSAESGDACRRLALRRPAAAEAARQRVRLEPGRALGACCGLPAGGRRRASPRGGLIRRACLKGRRPTGRCPLARASRGCCGLAG